MNPVFVGQNGDALMSRKILIADDEVSVCQLLGLTLDTEGYVTEFAYDGLETLDKVREWKPDLLLLDVMMPRLDGWSVVSELRSSPDTAELPVIMLTALGQDEAMVSSIMSGADVHLTKPLEPDELISIVKRLYPLDG